MQIGIGYHDVAAGDVLLIKDGAFHKVYNDSNHEDLVFVCVFDGKRNH
jgi:quercetin dioxygenase-like cupin family protein